MAECFGQFSSCVRGAECQYCAACRLFTQSEPVMERRIGGYSYERSCEWSLDLADTTHIPGTEEEPPAVISNQSDLLGFVNYLLHMDTYTLGVVAEIISPSDISAKRLSVAQMARIHGVSRQAMHRKLLTVAKQSPELRSLLRCVVLKIRKSKLEFAAETKKNKSNSQMVLPL